jgi:hypothetical protein
MDIAVVVLAGVLTGEVNPPNRRLFFVRTEKSSIEKKSTHG